MDCRRMKKARNKAEWLEQRKMGITGTDIAAIAGESNYSSPLSIYVDKIGLGVAKEVSEAMEIGTFMEDPIAQLWAQKNPDSKIRKVPFVLRHKKHAWMLGNIDRHIVAPKEGVLEIKCVGAHQAKRWGDEENPLIPNEYHLQVAWYMLVTGLEVCKVAALLGGTRFVERIVEYDKEMAEALMEIGNRFWHDHVLKQEPPALDGSDATEQAINRLYMSPTDDSLDLPQLSPWIERYDTVQAKLKEVEAEKTLITNNIKGLIQNHCSAATCGERRVTWKMQTTNRFDTTRFKEDQPALYAHYTNPSESRRLLIK